MELLSSNFYFYFLCLYTGFVFAYFMILRCVLQSFNLRRADSMEKKEAVHRPVANINVAAILEKANAIRQVLLHLHTI